MRHTIQFAALAVGVNILLCATVAYSQQQMHILDDQGKPVAAAEVTITCDKEKREGFADAGGTFSWAPMPPNSQCIVSIVSNRTEVFAAVLSIPASGIVNIEYKVKRKQVWVVQVTVIDDEKKEPIAGVEVKFDCGADTWYRTTNRSGVAELEKIIAATECRITTDHKLYEPIIKSFPVPRPMFEPVRVEVGIKRKINIKTVQVTVIDSETGKPVQDARVWLVGGFFSNFSGTTGPSGVADILIDRPGSFQIEVAQDNYYSDKSTTLVVEPGAVGESLAATISLARKPKQSGVGLAVTVMGKRLDGTIITLKNARIKVEGSDEVNTDADGKATARLPEVSGDLVNIVATANGYEPGTKSFLLPRYSSVIITPEVVFILTEKKREITAVNLVIEVKKRDDGKSVSGASVSIDGQGTTKTDSAGNARFTISNEFIKGKQYLRAIVTKPDFKEKWSDVGIDLLKPGEEPRYYSIMIELSKVGQDDIFLGTWNGQGNAKGITVTFNKDYTMTFSDTRPGYERSGKGEWRRDPDRVDCVASPISYALWYKNGKLNDEWGNFYTR
jgi:hypothetical protein